jgi:hypothetical protein
LQKSSIQEYSGILKSQIAKIKHSGIFRNSKNHELQKSSIQEYSGIAKIKHSGIFRNSKITNCKNQAFRNIQEF